MPETTFGCELERISLATDSISEAGLRRLYDASLSYIRRELKINKFELLLEEPTDKGPGLKPVLDYRDPYPAYIMRNDDNEPNGINAFSFINAQPLWLTVPEDQEEKLLPDLEPCEYEELWSLRPIYTQYTRIERESYRRIYDERTKTLICIPSRSRQRCWGVVYFESIERLIPVGDVKLEFERIAHSFSRLYELLIQESERQLRTEQAISHLIEGQDDHRFHFPYSLPLMFGIFPHQIDENIITAIDDSVKQTERYNWETWRELAQAGIVVNQIEDQLSKARYVIAYLSESQSESVDNKPVYMDNANVLYELGIFRGLLRARSEPARDAIIIREVESPPIPFDLFPYRRIEVPRSPGGGIDYAKLRQEVTKHIRALEP